MATSEYIDLQIFDVLLTALMPANRLALQISIATGLRIGDVLSLRTAQLSKGRRFTVQEQKTGKNNQVYIPSKLYLQALQQAGKVFVFTGRCDSRKHRTPAAVYKDLLRVCRLYRIDGRKVQAHLSPHSARKIFAVNKYRESRDLKKVQRLLNHQDMAVTMLYAMADCLGLKKKKGMKK